MDAKLLRNWGLAVGAAAMATSLSIAAINGHPGPAEPAKPAPIHAGPLPPLPHDGAGASEGVFQPADAQAPPAAPASSEPVGFLVRFKGAGPLGRAQTLAANGRGGEARALAQAALTRQAAFRGLCFDRFTVGGAEIVLRSCEPVAAGERARASQRWLGRLRAMRAVAYADANSMLGIENAH